jgi:hypothetical protein
MKLLIRPSVVLGAIAGLGFGILLLIPFIKAFACMTYVFIGAGIVFFLKRNALIGILSIQEGAIIGGISGFVAAVASAVVIIPIFSIINIISGSRLAPNLFSSFTVASYSLIVLPLIVLFMALLSALFNAFSALVVTYIYEKLESSNIKEKDGFIIDQE